MNDKKYLLITDEMCGGELPFSSPGASAACIRDVGAKHSGPTSAQLIFPRSDPSVSHLTSPHRASCLTVYQDIDVANLDIIFHASAWACAGQMIHWLEHWIHGSIIQSFLLRFYVKDAGVCRKTCILLFCYLLYIINRNFILLCSLLYLVYHTSISYYMQLGAGAGAPNRSNVAGQLTINIPFRVPLASKDITW